ncbi:NfeD family protein [candidate division WOR-3 bacterium]|nr:NfeD family protein [candidate division WOR-3 bacterium]
MPGDLWWIWLVLAAVFLVAEIFTAGFFIFWFGIGAAAAGLLALLGLNIVWQWFVFVVISGSLFIVSRRFAERFTKKQPPGIGADRFIGKIGVVLEDINNVKNTGRVRIDKDEWRADSETDDTIAAGTRVVVTRLDGTHVIVKISEGGK